MDSNVSCFHVLFVVITIIGFTTSLRPPLPFLPLEAPRFLEDIRQNWPPIPSRYRSQESTALEHIGADVRYTDTPVQIEAGFYIRPGYNGRGLALPHLFAPRLAPGVFGSFRELEKGLFTPSRKGERPETPGQVKNYQDDLQELEKEQTTELTTSVFPEDISTVSSKPKSFVNVGVTRGNEQEFKYNYAI